MSSECDNDSSFGQPDEAVIVSLWQAHRLLHRLEIRLEGHPRRVMRECAKLTQMVMLTALSRAGEGGLTQRGVFRAAGVKDGSASSNLNPLVREGFVSVERGGWYTVRITKKGRAWLRRCVVEYVVMIEAEMSAQVPLRRAELRKSVQAMTALLVGVPPSGGI